MQNTANLHRPPFHCETPRIVVAVGRKRRHKHEAWAAVSTAEVCFLGFSLGRSLSEVAKSTCLKIPAATFPIKPLFRKNTLKYLDLLLSTVLGIPGGLNELKARSGRPQEVTRTTEDEPCLCSRWECAGWACMRKTSETWGPQSWQALACSAFSWSSALISSVTPSSICSLLNKCLLSDYYMPGTTSGPWGRKNRQQQKVFLSSSSLISRGRQPDRGRGRKGREEYCEPDASDLSVLLFVLSCYTWASEPRLTSSNAALPPPPQLSKPALRQACSSPPRLHCFRCLSVSADTASTLLGPFPQTQLVTESITELLL
ncbi:uncharacterized protein LOC104859135 [Fukomys damarensis]|uniref:uncharacterized protein LOC104859135 n=1 Tax=Fukomys damarensis TaxID=885580 RepID=UPI00053F4803|nr:uncharacterized protein LOC104859135 [Fukomys damarensis]